MDKSYTLTRAEIAAAFRNWRADDVAGNCTGDIDDSEASADAFLKYAGLGEPLEAAA